jgi:PspA-Associated protein
VIVRISGEGQYRLDDSEHSKLDELDNAAVAAVDAGDEDAFHEAFEELLALVRGGEHLGDDDLSVSDHILPPADLTFPEATEEFTGDGLIPEPS